MDCIHFAGTPLGMKPHQSPTWYFAFPDGDFIARKRIFASQRAVERSFFFRQCRLQGSA
jgi:hypothetical protein